MWQVLALVMIIIAGAIHLFTGHTDNLAWDSLVQDTTTSPGRIALSFYSGLFSFAGWNYLNFVTEELQVNLVFNIKVKTFSFIRNQTRIFHEPSTSHFL